MEQLKQRYKEAREVFQDGPAEREDTAFRIRRLGIDYELMENKRINVEIIKKRKRQRQERDEEGKAGIASKGGSTKRNRKDQFQS